MSQTPIRFDGQVVIVTGAGNGLGKSHALAFAARGAKVVVNDLGGGVDGTGRASVAADAVVADIKARGGEAMADGANVADFAEVTAMVERTMSAWGRVDVLIANAGILRDKSFSKMDLADFRAVVEVHLMGSVNCCKAVWEVMRAQNYGRIVLTSSSSGLYGNFGQANYGAAKAAIMGLMNVLHIEGVKNGIRVNTLAPTAATRMTEALIPAPMLSLMRPEAITPGVLFLASKDAPSKVILSAGAGTFAVTKVIETAGVFLAEAERTPEAIAAQFNEISSDVGAKEIPAAWAQTDKLVRTAAKALGMPLPDARG